LPLCAVSLITSGFVLSANANERKTAIITFDPPGSQFTLAIAINPQGSITGLYIDSVGSHGYVRSRDGSFITFEVPGAGPDKGQCESINPAGTITGIYNTGLFPNLVVHGFVRASDGAITTFDVRDAGTGSGQGTYALNINPAGTIAGFYFDASNVSHGFVRAPNGAITTFDAPGAGTGSGQGTFTASTGGLNPAGAIVGGYLDASNAYHGYVRDPFGVIITFNVPGAGTGSGQGTLPGFLNPGLASTGFINPAGAVTGAYLDASNVFHGFVRDPFGVIITFNVLDAGTGSGQGTIGGSGINPAGAVTGEYLDASNVFHGFVRDLFGAITTFDAPGAGTGSGQGTIVNCINPAGAIVGNYLDSSNVFHGFLLESE
jgi:hypothetical protein